MRRFPLQPTLRPWLPTLALLLGFFALSMLAWSGTTHSSDGLSMAAVTDSLVRYGRWDTETIRWMGIQQGTIGPDGLLYSRKGFATSVIALPLAWLGMALPDIGPLHTVLLLTPLLHALTALYLYHVVRRLLPTVSREGALGVASLWAFGSLATPYIKTFFSEPAVALALVAALFHLLVFREKGMLRSAAAVGAWLGFSFVTRSANAIVFPLFALALLLYSYQHWLALTPRGKPRNPLRQWQTWLLNEGVLARLFAGAGPLVISGGLYLWYNWYRFGDPLTSGYIAGEEFSAIWWQGLVGLTISPGRGLLWYTPWLPLALFGTLRLWRRDRALTLVIAGSALLYVLVYAKWYLWSGGYAWGPRFLVPIVPLLALLVAPLLEPDARLHPAIPGGWRGLLWVMSGLGFLVNLIGVLWDFQLHQQALEATGLPLFTFESFINPRYAQISGLLRLGLETPNTIDLAWMVRGFPEQRVLAMTLAIALAGAGAGAWAWRKRSGATLLAGGSLLVAVGLWLMLGDLRAFQAPALREALALLPSPLPEGSQLWYDDPTASEALLNQIKEPVPITGFNVGGMLLSPDEEPRARRLARAATAPLFLLSDGPARLENGLDLILLDEMFWVGEQQAGSYRVAEYWQGPMSEPISYDLHLAFPDGAALTLREARVTPTVAPGQILALALWWGIETPVPPDTQRFLHLYNAAGERVVQQDISPTLGRRPPATWKPGDLILDRQALRLPSTLPPGSYTLQLGLYRLDDLARAVTPTGQSEVLIPITVE